MGESARSSLLLLDDRTIPTIFLSALTLPIVSNDGLIKGKGPGSYQDDTISCDSCKSTRILETRVPLVWRWHESRYLPR